MTKRGLVRLISAAFVVAGAGLCGGTAAAGTIYYYDASLGTLPEDQGFVRYEDPGSQPPVVSGGVLHQLPVLSGGGGGDQFWYQNAALLDFATNSYVLEANLKVLSSNYIANVGTGQRSGYYFQAFDGAGKAFIVGIASGGITINTDFFLTPNNGLPFTPFDSTDDFHAYRLEIGGGIGALFIDGALFGSAPMGGNVRPDVANWILFGDGSGLGVSETELRSFTFASTTPVPVPAALPIIGAGLAGFGFAGWRSKRRAA